MTEFELESTLNGAHLKVKRPKTTEIIIVKRPFYKDVLEVRWGSDRYEIARTGIVIRQAKIYKNKKYIGTLREQIGIMSQFNVFAKSKKVFNIHEEETIVKQQYNILKDGKHVGLLKPVGLYIPLISQLGKGLSGNYTGVTKQEEELLLMAVLAIGV